jgi:hypothetical protein
MKIRLATIILSCIAFLTLHSAIYAQQITLKPWIQVYGTTPGSFLGSEVRGFQSTPNFPFNASIYQFGNTGVYAIHSITDTAPSGFFFGENLQQGDLNGDGYQDIVIRRRGSNGIDTVLIFWGSPSGIDTTNPTKLHAEAAQDNFGSAMCIGNIVGDGISDLVISASDYPGGAIIQGRVYIYKGSSPFDTIPAVILNGDSARYTLGTAIAIGDINNDGHNDLIVRGMFQYGQFSERYDYLNIFYGGSSFDTTKDMQIKSSYTGGIEGLALFDANGDGIRDLLWTVSPSYGSLLQIYVHFGRSNFSSIPDIVLQNPGVSDFGNTIVDAGDMNGDGYTDIGVGAFYANQTSGFVFIFGGGPKIDSVFDAAVGLSSLSYFGSSVASIGDINGDGLADILVGAPNYEFGSGKGYWGIFLGDSTIKVTGVKENNSLPTIIKLYQSYPNPFNPRTTIRYDLSSGANIILEVVTVLGKHLVTLVNEYEHPGSHQVEFDGSGYASGTYFYRLTAKTDEGNIYSDTKKLILIK